MYVTFGQNEASNLNKDSNKPLLPLPNTIPLEEHLRLICDEIEDETQS